MNYHRGNGKRLLTINNGVRLTPTVLKVLEALTHDRDPNATAYDNSQRVVTMRALSDGIAFYTRSDKIA